MLLGLEQTLLNGLTEDDPNISDTHKVGWEWFLGGQPNNPYMYASGAMAPCIFTNLEFKR
jgi:hypothetical protein